jgi:hypothetical protein
MQDPGIRAQSANLIQSGQQQTVNLKMPPAQNTSGITIAQSSSSVKFENQPQGFIQKGYQSVLWSAHDENDDELRYGVYYRGESEHEWKLLKDNLDQKFYSWDTTALPDGAYYVKIVATDAPSNPPAASLKTERESERFEIDNTPPAIDNLSAVAVMTRGGSPAFTSILVKFTARDATSSIERAQYSLDGGEWTLVSPTGGITDAPEEHYEFLSNVGPGEHTIAVRAYDKFENVGSAKTIVAVPAPKM